MKKHVVLLQHLYCNSLQRHYLSIDVITPLATRLKQCLCFLRLMICCSISEGGNNHLTSIKSLVSSSLLNWVWKDQRVDLWNSLAVMFVFVSAASMWHLWFSFGCKWMGTVHSSGTEDVFMVLYCLYTDCLVQFWLLGTHDFSITVVINNGCAVGLGKSN